MTERKVGAKLSPRLKALGIQRVGDENQEAVESEVSTVAGQENGGLEAVLGANNVVETAQNDRDLDSEKVQNLDSEPMIATDTVPELCTGDMYHPPMPDIQELQKMLVESAEQASSATPMIVKAVTEAEMDELIRFAPGRKISISSPLGPQADGSFGAVVTISEWYVEGCKQAAESDGRTLDQWVSEQFQWFLDSYFSATKAR